ncbi:MAG: hypothetical protein ABSB42_21560 [Tepidisphaeraceae bacterium]|jgi:hypothetical protein
MKRFRRRIFDWLAAISLLLCVARVITWALTLHGEQGISFSAEQGQLCLTRAGLGVRGCT